MPARSTPRTALGNPIPISMTSLLSSWSYRGAMATGATLDELPWWARTLLAEARVGHLGLLDGLGRPRVLPVTFALAGGEAWSVIDDKPKRRAPEELARLRWLRSRPQSSITVDRYDDDWTRLAWVQLVGRTAAVPLTSREDVL